MKIEALIAAFLNGYEPLVHVDKYEDEGGEPLVAEAVRWLILKDRDPRYVGSRHSRANVWADWTQGDARDDRTELPTGIVRRLEGARLPRHAGPEGQVHYGYNTAEAAVEDFIRVWSGASLEDRSVWAMWERTKL